jgi:predicted ATPase/DNA-binding SARP family transcriptional activator
MEFHLLGPLEVLDQGVRVPIPAAKQRAVLAILVLRARTTVSGQRLIEELWGEHPPVSARKVVQTYISRLRQVLPAGMLVTRATGYVLCVDPAEVDATRFEHLVAEAGQVLPDVEVAVLRQALGLWRGRALEDFVDEPFAQADLSRLEGLRLAALERRIELDLAAGRHCAVTGELAVLVQENPLLERLRGQLMLALYRSGRQAEALRAYRDGRRLLVEQLGLEPSPLLSGLEQAILRQDPSLDLPASSVPSARTPGQLTAALRSPPLPHGSVSNLTAQPRRAWRHAPVSTFVGRVPELEDLQTLLLGADPRLVTLTGPAGTGKTRLALEVAARVGSGFRDGTAVVDLTTVSDHELVASAVGSALGLRPASQQDAAADLAAYLATRAQLLLLDNFEHVLPAAGLVEWLLAQAPGLRVLVTSRSPLHVPREHVFAVPPLGVPSSGTPTDRILRTDAVALFLDRARAVRPDLELTEHTASTIGQLCAHLDGLPLAIELAAARVDLLSPRAILSRLGQGLDLLATESLAVAERHRSLRAAVEWSYALLNEEDQATFCDLSVFAGGFTMDTAEAVVSAARGRLLAAVETLLRASLLRFEGAPGDEPRFGMLETIREYGRRRLEQSGRQAQRRSAHAAAFLALAEQAESELRGPDQVRWLSLLEAELTNIREALHWAARGGDADTGLFTAAYLWRFWQIRGRTDEARRQLEGLLGSQAGSGNARAAAHLTVARCAFHQGDLLAVQRHVAASLPTHRANGEAYAEGFGLAILGTATGRTGDTDRGLSLLEEALEVARGSQETWLEACCLGYLGTVLSTRGRHVQARHALEEGLRGARELGDSRLVGWFLIGLGRTALGANEPERARRRFREALTWERRLGDAWGEAWALQGLAGAAIQDHDLGAAVDLLLQSLGPAREAHSRPGIAGALRLLATVADARGRPDLAVQFLGAASVVSPKAGEFWAIDADGIASPEPVSLTATIGDAMFNEQWARGRGMSTDEAMTAGQLLGTGSAHRPALALPRQQATPARSPGA